jgi:hypothetical protein
MNGIDQAASMPSHVVNLPEPTGDLGDLIGRSGGIVRTADLIRHGASPSESDWPPAWRKLLPGIVFTAERSPTVRDRRRAALRYASRGALLTGLTALRLYGFRKLPAEWEVHVLVPARRRKASSDFVIVQRTERMPAHCWRDGLPCAPTARALVDAARRVKGAGVIRALLVQASGHPLCSILELANEFRLADGRGLRLPRRVFAEFCEEALTAARLRLRTMLERARLPPAVWEPDLPGRPVAWWPDRGVAVALDASEWALSPESALASRVGCHRLFKRGLAVVRVVPEELTDHPADVLAAVSTAVLGIESPNTWHELMKECA